MVGSRTTVLRRTSGAPFHVRSILAKLTLWDLGRIPHLGADASRVEESRIIALKPRDQFTEAAQGRKYVISPRMITPRSLIVGPSTTEDVTQSCKDLITSHFFTIESLPTAVAAHEGDHEGHLILRCAAIVVHTAMAILLRTLSEALAVNQDRSIAPAEDQNLSLVYRKGCRKSLKEAIKITRGLADPDFPFIDVAMAVGVYINVYYPASLKVCVLQVCWFQILTITGELDQEDVTMGISPERELSPPPSIPPTSKSPTIRNAQPTTRAEQIRQQQAQYHQERQQQQGSQPPPSLSTSASVSQSSGSSSGSPPRQATISEVDDDQPDVGTGMMPSIDEVMEELSDLQLLEKSTKQLQASFWRPVPEILTSKMHKILEGLRVVMENQEGVYYNH